MGNTSSKIPIDRKERIALQQIREALRGLDFGSLTIIVQDGVVVQIDKTSKQRIDYSALDKVAGGEGI